MVGQFTKSKKYVKKVLTKGEGCGILFRLSTRNTEARQTADHRQAHTRLFKSNQVETAGKTQETASRKWNGTQTAENLEKT